ncbi:hypothetical protein [Streptomyces sp. AS02]|uniref:hypothetical protein n=1 Tax=Streptomyces sp. AS02 TaxID=2938946 RepID=UPI00202144FC|nr:hypothetical protein [Streptomyces sp. AS02]MCL8016869.1 hypothetical protein [Streptomyces sp. AS02]
MTDETPDVPPSAQEMAALELFHQLVNLSADDGDCSFMLTLRLPNGRYVGDVWLSRQDVEHLADGAMFMADRKNHFSEQAGGPLPLDEEDTDTDPWPRLSQDDITEDLVEGLAEEFEEFLKSEGGQV